MIACTCGVGAGIRHVVHDGDCPSRCTYYERDSHSDGIAQCERMAGTDHEHSLNLYRGSPSRRMERGEPWPVPDPVCDEPVIKVDARCPYYHLEPENACTLKRGHREPHEVRSK